MIQRCSVNDRAIASNGVLSHNGYIERKEQNLPKYVYYALQLYASGLSPRKTSERLANLLIRRNHVSIWNWIQRYKPKRIFQSRRTISEFIIDETLIKAGSEYVWLWVAIEPRYPVSVSP